MKIIKKKNIGSYEVISIKDEFIFKFQEIVDNKPIWTAKLYDENFRPLYDHSQILPPDEFYLKEGMLYTSDENDNQINLIDLKKWIKVNSFHYLENSHLVRFMDENKAILFKDYSYIVYDFLKTSILRKIPADSFIKHIIANEYFIFWNQ